MATRRRESKHPERKRQCSIPSCTSRVVNLLQHYRCIHSDEVPRTTWDRLRAQQFQREGRQPTAWEAMLGRQQAARVASRVAVMRQYQPTADTQQCFPINEEDGLSMKDYPTDLFEYEGTPPVNARGLKQFERVYYLEEAAEISEKPAATLQYAVNLCHVLQAFYEHSDERAVGSNLDFVEEEDRIAEGDEEEEEPLVGLPEGDPL